MCMCVQVNATSDMLFVSEVVLFSFVFTSFRAIKVLKFLWELCTLLLSPSLSFPLDLSLSFILSYTNKINNINIQTIAGKYCFMSADNPCCNFFFAFYVVVVAVVVVVLTFIRSNQN